MWVRKVLIILLLVLFIFSIFDIVSARLFPANNIPPKTNEADPWAGTTGTGNTGGNSGPSSGIKSANTQINSCSLIWIGNIPVVFKVEVKNQMRSLEAKK